jgi:hypothetical protein
LSTQRSKIEELRQAIKILLNNPEMFARNPMLAEMVSSITPSAGITLLSFEAGHREEDLNKRMEGRVDEICKKIKTEVLEQIRSEISSLFEATKRQVSIEVMTRAINESIKMLSKIQEVKKIYAFIEPENIQLIIVHSASDRIDLLRKIVEIENSLGAEFENIYFDFKILHYSEVDENLILDGQLIFMRT